MGQIIPSGELRRDLCGTKPLICLVAVSMTAACAALALLTSQSDAVAQVNLTIAALKKLKNVSFSQTRELDYKSESYNHKQKWKMVLSLTLPFPPYAKYRVVQEGGAAHGYDGVAAWTKAKAGGPVEINQTPKRSTFDSFSFLTNGIPGQAQFLAAVLKLQGSAPRLSEKGKDFQTISLDVGKNRMSISQPLEPMQVPFRYEIKVSSQTHLPIQITQWLERPGDRIVTSFSDWNFEPAQELLNFSPP